MTWAVPGSRRRTSSADSSETGGATPACRGLAVTGQKDFVEVALEKTSPGKTLTLAVVAALPIAVTTAQAASAGVAAAKAGTGAKSAFTLGALGGLMAMLGAVLFSWKTVRLMIPMLFLFLVGSIGLPWKQHWDRCAVVVAAEGLVLLWAFRRFQGLLSFRFQPRLSSSRFPRFFRHPLVLLPAILFGSALLGGLLPFEVKEAHRQSMAFG